MHVCLFDIDGTLLNTGGAGQAAMEAAFQLEFGVVGLAEGLSTAGRTDRAIALDLFAYHQVAHNDQLLEQFYRAYLKQLPQHLASREGLVLPGVVSLLEALSARNDVEMGLLTGNFREGAQAKLGHFGLDHHFDFGGFGDRHVHRDDVAREAFDEVHRRFEGRYSHDRLWVIGDTPADIRCGRAIGAQVIAVATGHYSATDLEQHEPDLLYTDFSDVATFLARML